jgi:hypothetical protein
MEIEGEIDGKSSNIDREPIVEEEKELGHNCLCEAYPGNNGSRTKNRLYRQSHRKKGLVYGINEWDDYILEEAVRIKAKQGC